MQVVILCGGKGTRLRELTEDIPKPLVEIGGKPILWHIMKIYSHHGFNDFILCLGYKGSKIEDYFKKHKNDWSITFVDTGENSLKSQRLMQIKEYIKGDTFLCAYGDDVCDVDIKKIIEFHKKNKKIATLTAIPLYSQFGIVEIDKNGAVGSFKEKPRLNDYWFNGGYFVFDKKIFDYLDKGELEKEVFEFLASQKQIQAYRHEGFWKSMNTFKDTIELNQIWDKGQAPWQIWQD